MSDMRQSPLATCHVTTRTAAATRQFGVALGRAISRAHGPQHDGAFVVALHGDLGAGKTTLTQGLAVGLGIEAQITSPTFTLINEYAAPDARLLIHMDSYRLAEAPPVVEQEAAALGLDEILDLDEAVLVIEWADRLAGSLPADHLSIALTHAERATPEQTSREQVDGVRCTETPANIAPANPPAKETEQASRHITCTAHGSVAAHVLRDLADSLRTAAPADCILAPPSR